ncbi:UNC93-like protein [Caerostris extrusa]|uniref:UNC93-like protein n=1 Tax=Caerostris extrusa TaxID=172846 RepID=A0AAV4QA95_CAEEX|nr:UNC93-like protein [Caerostris extrusa]
MSDRRMPNVVASGREYSPSETTPCLLDPTLQRNSSNMTLNFTSRSRILKNLFVVSLGYCLFYSGFWALTNLQSTMNAVAGMGPDSQAVIYGFSMVSSLFLPELTIDRFGCKTVLIGTSFLCLPYIAANIYLRWDSLMVSSALYGLASGPFSAALTVYIDEIALRFERTVDENVECVMSTFFGAFAFSMENTQVWGNALSYFILKPESHIPSNLNVSLPEDCGIHFDPNANATNTNLTPPTAEERYLLVGIFVGMGLLALLLFGLFLDPLRNDIKREGCDAIAGRFVSSLRHYRTLHQILLIPLTVLIGIESALYSNEFTQAYIACSWGVHHVGFVTVCFRGVRGHHVPVGGPAGQVHLPDGGADARRRRQRRHLHRPLPVAAHARVQDYVLRHSRRLGNGRRHMVVAGHSSLWFDVPKRQRSCLFQPVLLEFPGVLPQLLVCQLLHCGRQNKHSALLPAHGHAGIHDRPTEDQVHCQERIRCHSRQRTKFLKTFF